MSAMHPDEAKAIVATVMATGGAATRIDPLLKEYTRLLALGNVDQAGETARTIDDLCGHWRDGVFVGAAKIVEAFRRIGAMPSGSAAEWETR